MALAQRLNELAVANSDGLLNDDEYRLLRQNVFEQYSTHIPVMPSNTPAATPVRPKQSVSSTVASLLRRATGRLAPQRRPANLAPLHTDIRPPPSAPRAPSSSSAMPSLSIPPLPSPPHPYADRPMPIPGPASPLRDVFDESALHTASPADLRAAIAATEHEARRLADAFADLERSTLRRIRKQRARRLPLATPTTVDVLLEGREWREHRLATSPSSPLFDSSAARVRGYPLDARPAPGAGDGVSIRSGSSHQTSRSALSASRSVSSLPRSAHPPPSPSSSLAPPMSPSTSASSSTPFHFRIPSLGTARTRLSRRGSLASVVSSQSPPQVPPAHARATGKLSAPPSQYHPPPPSGSTGTGTGALARSSSYLGLRRLVAGASSETVGAPRPGPATTTGSAVYLPLPPHASDDGDGDGYGYSYGHGRYSGGPDVYPDPDPDADGDPDADADADAADDDATALRDIRRRREDLVARYTARLEFLRAKLRGAEIQERLRRK